MAEDLKEKAVIDGWKKRRHKPILRSSICKSLFLIWHFLRRCVIWISHKLLFYMMMMMIIIMIMIMMKRREQASLFYLVLCCSTVRMCGTILTSFYLTSFNSIESDGFRAVASFASRVYSLFCIRVGGAGTPKTKQENGFQYGRTLRISNNNNNK